jgi:hypothetical protein
MGIMETGIELVFYYGQRTLRYLANRNATRITYNPQENTSPANWVKVDGENVPFFEQYAKLISDEVEVLLG